LEKDYYNILGINRSTKKDEIIRIYRKLAAKYHPDKHQGNPLADLAEEKFKEINEAYHALVGEDYEYTVPIKSGARKKRKNVYQDISERAKDSLYRGINYFNEGDFQRAIQNFTCALNFSKSPTLYNLLGLALCEAGEYKKAVPHLIRATELDETNGKYFFDAGYAFYHLKLWDSSIQHFLEAYNLIEDNKRLASNCVYIAICNYNTGKIARAEFFLEEAVNYDPENSSYQILLEEFKISLDNESPQKLRILNKINRFSIASRVEESLGNLFHTLFSK